MKFSAVLLSTLAAVAVAQSTSSTEAASTAVPTQAGYTREQIACLEAAGNDVAKKAECFGNPGPTEDMVNATTECAAQCEQGNGTEAETKKYADCVQACIRQEFFSSTLGSNAGGAAPTQAPSDDEDSTTTRTSSAVTSRVTSTSTNSDGEEVTSVATETRTDSSEPSATEDADTADDENSAAGLKAGALTGFAALFAALFAL